MPSLMETLNMGLDITGVVADFSSRARILGGCSTTHSPPQLYIYMEIGRAHQFQSLGRDQSIVAQPAEMTVAEYSLTSCV